jgi:hypothetical protein
MTGAQTFTLLAPLLLLVFTQAHEKRADGMTTIGKKTNPLTHFLPLAVNYPGSAV